MGNKDVLAGLNNYEDMNWGMSMGEGELSIYSIRGNHIRG